MKWRFLDAETNGVDMSIYPQFGINTASSLARVGLVESGASFFMPVEIARTFGKWELDAGTRVNLVEHAQLLFSAGLFLSRTISDCLE